MPYTIIDNAESVMSILTIWFIDYWGNREVNSSKCWPPKHSFVKLKRKKFQKVTEHLIKADINIIEYKPWPIWEEISESSEKVFSQFIYAILKGVT